MNNKDVRNKAYKEGELPSNFTKIITREFVGKKCPICNAIMKPYVEDGFISKMRMPTIQHNVPISKGGKHCIDNISVICKKCNISIRDIETSKLNCEEVKKVWGIVNGRTKNVF